MPANRPATDRVQSLRPLFSWMTSTPPRAFGASAQAACSSPCGPAQVIGVVGSAPSVPGGGALAVAGRWPWPVHWTSPVPRRRACPRCTRRSGRWPPRCRCRAVPGGAGLRVWTAGRRCDRLQFLRRCSAVTVSPSRVCACMVNRRWESRWRAILAGWTGHRTQMLCAAASPSSPARPAAPDGVSPRRSARLVRRCLYRPQ